MKVLGIKQFHQKTFKFLDISKSPLKGLLGNLIKAFVIVVKGFSGNGKTELVVLLAKLLSYFGKVAWLSYEQGHGADLQMATMRNDMEDHSGAFYPVDPWENLKPGVSLLEDLDSFLGKRNSPDFIIIDSWDDTGFTYADYQYLKNKYSKKKGIVIIGRCSKSGKMIKKVCEDIGFNAHMTLFVSDYIAYPEKNRLGGTEPFVIWEEEARKRNPLFFSKRVKGSQATSPQPPPGGGDAAGKSKRKQTKTKRNGEVHTNEPGI